MIELVPNPFVPLAHQCAWCSLVTDGEYAGMLFFLENQGVLETERLQSYSHGCCPRCDMRQRSAWKRERYYQKHCQDGAK